MVDMKQYDRALEYIKEQTQIYANKMIGEDVTIKFSWNLKRTLGRCHKASKTITYSLPCIRDNADKLHMLKDLAIHECGHLLELGHGAKFKAVMLKYGVGANHTRKIHNDMVVTYSWVATCNICGYQVGRHKKSNIEASCGQCSDTYDPDNKLVWSKAK